MILNVLIRFSLLFKYFLLESVTEKEWLNTIDLMVKFQLAW